MAKNVVVFDLDGCLVNNRHRLHLLDKDRWAEYNAAWEGDTPIPQGIVICRAFLASPHYKVLFITSRSEQNRENTLAQLHRFVDPKIRSNQLWMRPDGIYDNSNIATEDAEAVIPDTEMKLLLLEAAGHKPEEVFLLYEDRTSTVKAWRDKGVVVLQPAEWD